MRESRSTGPRLQAAGGWMLILLLAASQLSVSHGIQEWKYAVQVKPVVFLQEPASTVTLLGSTLRLTCQARVKPLISGYPLPEIFWRHNGSEVSVGGRIISSADGLSTLEITATSFSDAGYYECEARDGRLFGKEVWRYITISQRAVVEIIDLSSSVTNMTVSSGQPLLLPCGTTLQTGTTHYWMHNGMVVSSSPGSSQQRWTQLRNGSLLVYSAMAEDSGEWQCATVTGSGVHTNTSRIAVSIGQGNFSGPPLVIINAVTSPTPHAPFTLRCLTAPNPHSSISWQYSSSANAAAASGQGSTVGFVSHGNSHLLEFKDFNLSHAGIYTCQLIENGQAIASASKLLTLTAPPNITNLPPAQDIYLDRRQTQFTHTCLVDGIPAPTVRWFKDGQPLGQQLYNTTSGILLVQKSNVSNWLYGVYQCFAENTAGVQYAIVRVLLKELANPPGNVRCSVREARGDDAEFTVSWSPPEQIGGFSAETLRFIVKYEHYDEDEERVAARTVQNLNSNMYTFSIPMERNENEVVDIFIQADRPVNGLDAICKIDPYIRFVRDPMPLILDFENSTGNLTVKWTFAVNDFAPYNIYINGSCVYGKEVSKFNGALWPKSTNTYERQVFSHLSNGTVCFFRGSYRLRITPPYSVHEEEQPNYSSYMIPVTSGHIPPPPATNAGGSGIALGLSCHNSTVQLIWAASNDFLRVLESFNVTGLCVNESGDEERYFLEMSRSSISNSSGLHLLSRSGMGPTSLCGFTGIALLKGNRSFYDIAPVQCIMDVFSPEFTFPTSSSSALQSSTLPRTSVLSSDSQFTFPTSPTSALQSSTLPQASVLPSNSSSSTTATATNTGFILTSGVVVAVTVSATVLFILLAGLLTVVLLCVRVWRKQLTETQYFETMLYRYTPNDYITTIDIDDNISVKTEEQSLHHTEYFGSIPSLSAPGSEQTQELFSKELCEEGATGRKDKLVKGDDSGCIIRYPVEPPPSKLDHTGSSSGYGSSYAPDSVTYSAKVYHESLIPDLPEEGGLQQQPDLLGKESKLSCFPSHMEESTSFCPTDVVMTDNPSSQQTVIHVPIEGDASLRACSSSPETVPYSLSPHLASYCINCSHCGEVTRKRRSQEGSLNSVGEDRLSQSSEGSEYMNCLKCDHCGHNNCVYTDEKGYIRFKVTSV